MIGLTRTARTSNGRAWLYGWRPGADVVAWLRRLGISWVQPRAAGVWLQDGRAVRFLLHVDDETPAPLSGDPAPPAAHALRGYHRTAVPATCLLLLCATALREEQLHEDLAAEPLPVPVAATTLDRLYTTKDLSGPIWTVTAPATGGMVRLVDVTGV
jgi:hypothetical protein